MMPHPSYNRKYLRDMDRLEQIKTRAYYLWEQAGKPEGKELDFWLEAELAHSEEPLPAVVLSNDENDNEFQLQSRKQRARRGSVSVRNDSQRRADRVGEDRTGEVLP
jgi:Protein of unknown function (DUF2934)